MADKIADINQFARYTFNQNKRHIKGQILGADNREYALRLSKNSGSMYFLPDTNQILSSDGARYDMDDETKRIVKRYMRTRRIRNGVLLFVAMGAVGTVMAGIAAIAIYPIERKNMEIKKKVSAYEKTLPGYLEQKQRVEQYRDSLVRARHR